MYPHPGPGDHLPTAEAVLHELPVPVIVTAVDGRVIYWNRAAETVFGASSDTARGRSIAAVAVPTERATLARIGESLRTGGVWEGDFVVPEAGGRPATMHYMIAARGGDGDGAGDGAHWNVSVGFDVSSRKDRDAVLARLAGLDELTGLQNRVGLHEWLEANAPARSAGRDPLAVCFIDLDHFKLVNDVLGHQVGDELLVEVAARLRRETSGTAVVARLGGDEFVVAAHVRSVDGARDFGEHVRKLFAEPFHVDDQELFVSASVGVAIVRDESADAIVRNADAAMYIAKRRGRNRSELFDGALQRDQARRLSLAHDLHHAIANAELQVLYQPIFRVPERRIVGAEALLRWCHPTEGALPPAEFVRIAEDTGTIGEIGAWVLDQACAQLAAWQQAGLAGPELAVAVNVSTRQLAERGMLAVLRDTLDRHGIDGSHLWVEITETAYRGDTAEAHDFLVAARALGVRVAIDDFGTGFSSLARLREFPIDAVKIDRSFVAGVADDARDASIVAAILAMGRGLGFAVVAEGVETTAQVAALESAGCAFAQGHLLGRPSTGDALGARLARDVVRAR